MIAHLKIRAEGPKRGPGSVVTFGDITDAHVVAVLEDGSEHEIAASEVVIRMRAGHVTEAVVTVPGPELDLDGVVLEQEASGDGIHKTPVEMALGPDGVARGELVETEGARR